MLCKSRKHGKLLLFFPASWINFAESACCNFTYFIRRLMDFCWLLLNSVISGPKCYIFKVKEGRSRAFSLIGVFMRETESGWAVLL